MGANPRIFRDQAFYSPGAAGEAVAQDSTIAISDEERTLVIIHTADNGADCNDPNLGLEERIYRFGSFQEARRVLRSGELLEACNIAFNASPASPFDRGPAQIIAMNISPNVAATATIPTTGAGTVTLTAGIPGPAGNRIRVRKPTARTVEIGNDLRPLARRENVGFDVFSLQYIGDAATAVLEVNATGIAVVLAGQTDGSANLAANFADFETLGELYEFVNSQDGYVLETLESFQFPIAMLDHVESSEGADVKTARTLTADAFAEEQFIAATGFASFAGPALRKPMATSPAFTYLSGGATVPPAADAYRKAIDQQKDIRALRRVVLSDNFADLMYLQGVVSKLNSASGKNECKGGGGASSLTAYSDRLSQCRQLASRFICYGVTPFYFFDTSGDERLFPGKFLTVLHYGMESSASARESTTWETTNVIRAAEIHDDYDEIIKAGGLALRKQRIGNAEPWVINRAVTTEQSGNLVYNESSTMSIALVMVKRMREFFDNNYIGKVLVDATSPVPGKTDLDIRTDFERVMDSFVADGLLAGSTLLGEPPWYRDDYRIGINGDSFYFTDVKGNVATPINFVFFLMELLYHKGTAGA